MDLSNPLVAVTPTLDATVLLVLSSTTGACTGREVHRRATTGSADGVRRVLARLVAQGVVEAEEHAHATLYRLNRDHVAAGPIMELSRLRATIIDRIRLELGGWTQQPAHASIFGSFARGEAGPGSDIDILLVTDLPAAESTVWSEQVDRLAQAVRRWTGNAAHIVELEAGRLRAMAEADDPLVGSWRADTVALAGRPLPDLLRSLRTGVVARASTGGPE